MIYHLFQILYKGRPLLEYCSNHTVQSLSYKPTSYSQKFNVTASFVQTVDKQVETGDDLHERQMSVEERWLNERLSTCVVRLFKETDLLPNADLPTGFWSTDYSTIRLPLSMWKSVDCW